jgi:hypothetical protein
MNCQILPLPLRATLWHRQSIPESKIISRNHAIL